MHRKFDGDRACNRAHPLWCWCQPGVATSRLATSKRRCGYIHGWRSRGWGEQAILDCEECTLGSRKALEIDMVLTESPPSRLRGQCFKKSWTFAQPVQLTAEEVAIYPKPAITFEIIYLLHSIPSLLFALEYLGYSRLQVWVPY